MCTLEPGSLTVTLHSRVPESGSEFLFLTRKKSRNWVLINRTPYPSKLTFLCKGFPDIYLNLRLKDINMSYQLRK